MSTEHDVATTEKGVESLAVSDQEVLDQTLLNIKPLPAKRPWYKFFDEYEYRDLYERNGVQHKWYHWFDENDTPEERRYIIKLDLFITSYCFLSYWVKNLDQTNVSMWFSHISTIYRTRICKN